MKILITGCAGFIGFHLSQLFLSQKNINVFGIDNLNHYYDVSLKKDRLKILKDNKKFIFKKIDLIEEQKLDRVFKKNKFDIVINLAAQAGVRNSIINPKDYLESNLIGFFNIINLSRIHKIKHFIFASTSSVYGDSTNFPLKENDDTDKPLSFYAATKKSNEVIAYSYSKIYDLPTTGLRFFTVYGPYGRPDMSLFKFVKSIKNNKNIELFNFGKHLRDFTYVDDVTKSILKILKKKSKNNIPHQILNIGSNNPIKLKFFLKTIEKYLNKKAKIKYLPLQKGDVYKTHANIRKLQKISNFTPKTSVESGVKNFVDWFESYYE